MNKLWTVQRIEIDLIRPNHIKVPVPSAGFIFLVRRKPATDKVKKGPETGPS